MLYYVSQKRGVVEAVDYGATGEVNKVDIDRIRERLDNESIAILSNLGYWVSMNDFWSYESYVRYKVVRFKFYEEFIYWV